MATETKPADKKSSKSELRNLVQSEKNGNAKPIDFDKENPLGAGVDFAIFHPPPNGCGYIQAVPSAASYHAPAVCPSCGGGGVVVLDRDEQRTTLTFQQELHKAVGPVKEQKEEEKVNSNS